MHNLHQKIPSAPAGEIMTRQSKKIYLFLLLITAITANSNDDIHQNEQLDKQIKIFNNFEKLQRDNEKRDSFAIDKPALLPESEEPCFITRSIHDEGITLLQEEKKQSLYRQYVGKCNTLTDLTNLARQLTGLYIDKGYVTSQVYIKPQNISDGEVTLYALEGRIKKITPEESYIHHAFRGEEENFLNIRELENALETINRLPSNRATMNLLPSEQVGYTDISIENNPSNRLNGVIGINNFGIKKTGDKQGSLSLNYDNPLDINDQISINLNSTDKHFQNENSTGDSYEYSVPYKNLLATIGYRQSSYRQLIHGGINEYESNGHTKTYTFSLQYQLFHDQFNRISMGSSVSQYKTENYLSDSLIETASYDLSKAMLSMDYSYQNRGLYAYLALGYTKGTDWFNAYNPTDLNEKYSLYTVDFLLMQQLSELQYTFTGHYQHSSDQLFSVNQISIGGHYSVRGYQKEGLKGNTGFYARNELSYESPLKWFDIVIPSYFIALDYGKIHKEDDVVGGKLSGGALGVKLKKDSFNLMLYYARPFLKRDVEEAQDFIGFSSSYRF